ncbi:MAG: ParA family protein [Candidatus Adiutrix sp.]|jgi:chromosome partitioning protein|nr:ParA family protein [Candidatus Adiutrix sp.]
MAEIIAIVNQKGGVGKTTTAVNVGACLAASGKKTLLIDADQQGNSTSSLGISKKNLKESFYDFMLTDVPLKDIIMDTPVPELMIVPSNNDSAGIDQEVAKRDNSGRYFKRLLDERLANENYDFVIIDAPPTLNPLAINIMAAVGRILVPMQAEYLALEGLADLIETYKWVRENLNHDLSILGVLITMYSGTNLSKEVAANLRQNMNSLVFDTVIPKNIKLAESPSFCLPIIMYDPKSSGSLAYQALTKEILDRTAANSEG